MEPEFALRMEHGGSRRLRAPDSFNGAGVCTPDGTPAPFPNGKAFRCFNGAGVCTPDGTRPRHSLQTRTDASMEPEFALRMEPVTGRRCLMRW